MAKIADAVLVTLGINTSSNMSGYRAASKAYDQMEVESKKKIQALDAELTAEAAAFARKQTMQEDDYKRRLKLFNQSESVNERDLSNFKNKQSIEAEIFKKTQVQRTNDFKAAQDAELKAAKDNLQDDKDRVDSISKISGKLAGLISQYAHLGAVKKFGQKIVAADTQVSRTAESVGVAPEKLGQWESAASNFGVGTKSVEDAFRGMNKHQEDMAEGGPDAAKKQQKLDQTVQSLEPGKKVDWGKFSDKDLNAEERLIELSKVFHQVSLKTATALGAQLGQSEEMVRVLQRGPEEIQKMLKHAAEIRPQMKEATDESQRLSEKWSEITERATGIGEKILVSLGPAIETVLDWLTGFLDYAKDHIPLVEGAFAALAATIAGLSAISFATFLSSLAGLTGGLGAAVTSAASLVSLLGTGGLVVAVGAASYALGSFVNDALSALITKLTGADASLGTWIYDLTHPEEEKPTSQSVLNNNPGNLYFAGQSTATQADPNGLAMFRTMDDGIAALVKRLQSFEKTGNNTAEGIISTFAPQSGINKQNYISAIETHLGVNPGAHLNLDNPDVLKTLIRMISDSENGQGQLSLERIDQGVNKVLNTPSGKSSVPVAMIDSTASQPFHLPTPIDKSLQAGAGAALAANTTVNNNQQTSSNSKVETNFSGTINIVTQATDANGIAAGLASALTSNTNNYVSSSQAHLGAK